MIRSIFIIVILLLGRFSFGQSKDVSIPINNKIDTSYWYEVQQNKYSKAGLPNLINSSDTLHIRFSNEVQAIDVWTNDFKTFYGTFTNFTTSTGQEIFFSDKSYLDTGIAKLVYKIFIELSIFNIPTIQKIPKWEQGFDGKEFIIEYSTPKIYSFKEYWSPSYFKNKIKMAATIDSLTHRLEETLQMQQSFGKFITMLPSGCYHGGSILIECTEKTEK